MAIHIQCPICSERYDISNLAPGKRAKCACSYRLLIPDRTKAVRVLPLTMGLGPLGLTSITPVGREASEPTGSNESKAMEPVEASSGQTQGEDTHPVLLAIQEGNALSLRLYSLRQQAEKVALVSGFDHLICLPLLKGVESHEYQERTARHVLRELGSRALLGDEVGLGKTIEAAIILKELYVRGLIRKILILTPASLVTQWKDELAAKFHIEFQIPRSLKDWKTLPRIISSIDTAKGSVNAGEIHSIKWDMIIVDEAHKLKDKKTLNWKFVNRIPKRYILLLSATPFQNDLLELFNLITLLKPGQLYTEKEYKTKFLKRGDKRQCRDPELLKSLLRQVMVRNRRGEVDVRFTQRLPETKHLDMFPHEREMYDTAVRFCREYFGRLYGPAAGLVAVGYLKQLGSSTFSFRESLVKNVLPRAEATNDRSVIRRAKTLLELSDKAVENVKLESLLQDIAGHRDKVIVFTQYRATQDYIAARLRIESISHVVFNGSMDYMEKDRAIGDFKRSSRILLSTESGGEGRNLQFANRLVNYDLPWNPMRVEQRIGRIHRIGQTRDVHITSLACKDTIEDYLLALLERKLNLFRLVVGEVEGILGKMKFDECIIKLFMQSRNNREFKERLKDFGEEIAALRSEYEKCKEDNSLVLSGLGGGMKS